MAFDYIDPSLTESENPHLGSKVYRYEGDDRWQDCGTLSDTEAINGIVVYQGEQGHPFYDRSRGSIFTPIQPERACGSTRAELFHERYIVQTELTADIGDGAVSDLNFKLENEVAILPVMG